MKKLNKLPRLKKIVSKLKTEGKVIVFTNGCFDILHLGHLKILKEAKQQGDILIVGLNSDISIKKIKGSTRPIQDEITRSHILANMELVDYVILFEEKTPYNIIKALTPDVLVKGGDWTKNNIIGNDLVKKIYRVKLCSGLSTTNTINKIKNA
ncbi:MAG: adenylyltransferase/cytidyltransferase family protein [Candidatus Omnitrophica bacterium]|nr:adenylyltransferase/cytidyltransferase family protein [Candidatus Omnitrophota bacterium]MCK5493636.1 adenylyltransferase/cytidyltransferase family protein [Candidatus Omnitrophota bacterium]